MLPTSGKITQLRLLAMMGLGTILALNGVLNASTADAQSNVGICDRTPQVQAAILYRLQTVSDCAQVTNENLAKITGLYFQQTGLVEVKSNDFAGLSMVTSLTIFEDPLTGIADDALTPLVNLERLSLISLQLTWLPIEFVSTPPTRLKALKLKDIGFATLPNDLFENLPSESMRYLDLENVALTQHQVNAIARHLPKLEFLSMVSTGISGEMLGSYFSILAAGSGDDGIGPNVLYIGSGDLSDWFYPELSIDQLTENRRALTRATNLRQFGLWDVRLSAKQIEEILRSLDPEGMLEIGLGGMSIRGLSFEVFRRFNRLHDVYLHNVGIDTEMMSDLISNLGSVIDELSLTDNEISSLPENGFLDLARHSDLSALWLDGNKLSQLSADALAGLDGLKRLDLSENELTGLSRESFSDLTSLDFLQLEGNNLDELPSGIFAGLNQMKYLRIYDNELTGLPEGGFEDLTNLLELDLSGNALTQLSRSALMGLSKLRKLDISNNELTDIQPGTFEDLVELNTLDLRDNAIDTLRLGTFEGLSTLRNLLLSGNNLTAIDPAAFAKLNDLHLLTLADNPITNPPKREEFDFLPSLRLLYLPEPYVPPPAPPPGTGGVAIPLPLVVALLFCGIAVAASGIAFGPRSRREA